MPFGAPFHTVPKSACRPVDRPILAIKVAELGSTGSAETSWFHGLSGGNIGRLPMKAPAPSDPVVAVVGGDGCGCCGERRARRAAISALSGMFVRPARSVPLPPQPQKEM